AEEEAGRELTRISPTVGHNRELIGRGPAHRALTHRRECGHHHHKRVVANRLTVALRSDEVAKLFHVETNHRLFEGEVDEALYPLVQRHKGGLGEINRLSDWASP